ncbi:MAG: beta-galactosidase [Prevotellaceae bacterium]|nr:beta-galactosidase [Prevotellaceae bacterium]
MRRLPLLLLLPLFLAKARSQEMPVVGYMGVPKTETTLERYLEMRDCGFNTSLAVFDNVGQVLEALRIADSVGMRLIPYCHDYFRQPATSVPKTDGYASLLAYLVMDEPCAKDLPKARERISGINGAGATKPCYVNLRPYYSDKSLERIGSSSYTEYLQACSAALQLPFISFDHYPVLHGDSIRATWYDNMQMVRDEALRTGKPFWAFVLCTPHLVYSLPTLAQLRLQVNVNLAYGAQAIQYYTYWHISNPKAGYHDSPIDSLGNRTETYRLVRQVNEELRRVAPLFYQGTITEVRHVSRRYASVSLRAPAGAVAARLVTAEGSRYIVLVNKSLTDTMTTRRKSESRKVEPGGMLLLPEP